MQVRDRSWDGLYHHGRQRRARYARFAFGFGGARRGNQRPAQSIRRPGCGHVARGRFLIEQPIQQRQEASALLQRQRGERNRASTRQPHCMDD